jgi:hypothetical protein
MLAAIRNRTVARAAKFALLAAIAGAFASCATKEKKPPLLISSGQTPESQLPWNQSQKWEQEGQLTGMSDRLNAR